LKNIIIVYRSYSETQSDPFSRYYISRGNTGQQEARPIPPKPGKVDIFNC